MNGEVALNNTPAANRNTPAFLQKLFRMINDHTTDELIRWNDAGDSFIVSDHEALAKEVLCRYYKHSQFSSFVRQLNMYGFHKIPHIEDHGNSRAQDQILEFSNPNFLRDQPDLLALVTRKKSGEPGEKDNLDYNSIMNEIQAIKRHQMTISQDLKRIQADNQSLWQEQIDTRSRHSKHQETIEKILTFLGTVYGNQYNSEDKSLQPKPKKRRLLLEDAPDAVDNLDMQDVRTKETFEDMFKSASTSPKLRPLRKPASEVISARTDPNSETRFTLLEHEARQQQLINSADPRQGLQPYTNNHNSASTSLQAPYSNGNDLRRTTGNPARQDRSDLDLSLALSPAATSEQLNPADMQLTRTAQRLSENDARTKDLEKQVAMTDQSLETLADLLGMSVADLGNLDPNDLYNAENDFDAFMNPDASYAPSAQGSDNLNFSSNLPAGQDPFLYGMDPPLYVPGSEQNGHLKTPINGLKSESATTTPSPIVSAPGSSTGSVKGEEEEIEEIDMDKARGKKRKSQG